MATHVARRPGAHRRRPGRQRRPASSSPRTCPSSIAGSYFARCHPERSYVVAGRTANAPAAMYLSTEQPAHSIRAHGDWLLVGGESHKTGQADAAERYARLEAWARERFAIEPVLRWATQDHMPVDGVPYVGRHDPALARAFASPPGSASGASRWATAAAELLAAADRGRDHRLARRSSTRSGCGRGASAENVRQGEHERGAALPRRSCW